MPDPISSSQFRPPPSSGDRVLRAVPRQATPNDTEPQQSQGAQQLVASVTASSRQVRNAALAAASTPPADPAPASQAKSHSLGWHAAKAGMDAACLALPCKQALGAAKSVMPDGGLGESMLDHFRSGSADPVFVDLNAEMERNPELKEFVASRVEFFVAKRLEAGASLEDIAGAFWIRQGDYGPTDAGRDQRAALGGTFLEFQVSGTADDGGLQVTVNVADHYFWSPTDPNRVSQCLHQCATDMVENAQATEFSQYGAGTITIADPRIQAPMSLLLTEPQRTDE